MCGRAHAQEKTSVGDLFNLYAKSLVLIEGKEGRGSGACLTLKGVDCVVTNIHVLAQNSDVIYRGASGQKLTVSDPVFASGYDIARLTTKEQLTPLKVMTGVDQKVRIGDRIVIFGNSEGAGVFAPIEGAVTGIGPRLIEIDAPIVPGNSGSPIIHVKSGMVIGIASHLIDRTAKSVIEAGSTLPSVRKFGQRIDTIENWAERTAPQFEDEWVKVQAVQRRTKDLVVIHDSLVQGPPDEAIARRLSAPLNNLMTNFARELRQAEANNNGTAYLNTLLRYFSALEQSTSNDILSIQQASLISYHRELLVNEQEIRHELWKRYAGVLDRLRNVANNLARGTAVARAQANAASTSRGSVNGLKQGIPDPPSTKKRTGGTQTSGG
jgi:DNA-binding transcriptional regulator YhcF (GntR family)